MDFTREPIIETIITPKDGCKLVVRSSKGTGQEEYFVDAVEVVSFAHSFFFRSLERPKSFLVPVTDYEIVEVREARIVLKNVGPDRSIKIGGGRESTRAPRDEKVEIAQPVEEEVQVGEQEAQTSEAGTGTEARPEGKVDKKRDRRRHYRKRRGGRDEKDEAVKEEPAAAENVLPPLEPNDKVDIQPPEENIEQTETLSPLTNNLLTSLLQPPPTLISETINRYRENALFRSAFFLSEEEQYKPHDKVQELLNEEDDEDFAPSLQEPTFDFAEQGQGPSAEETTSLLEDQAEIPSFEKIEEEQMVNEEGSEEIYSEENYKVEEEFRDPFLMTMEEAEQEETSLSLYAEEEGSNGGTGDQEEANFLATEAPKEEATQPEEINGEKRVEENVDLKEHLSKEVLKEEDSAEKNKIQSE